MFLKESARKYNHLFIAEGVWYMREQAMNGTHLTLHREHFRAPSQDDLREKIYWGVRLWFTEVYDSDLL